MEDRVESDSGILVFSVGLLEAGEDDRVLVNGAMEERNMPVISWLSKQFRDTKNYRIVLAQ